MKGLVFEAGPGGENTRPYLKKQSKTKWAGSMSGGLFPQCLKFITSYCIKKNKKKKEEWREGNREEDGRESERKDERKERKRERRKEGKERKKGRNKSKEKSMTLKTWI
jgi:hypothetical protein